MDRSFLVMNLVVCTKFHGYRPKFEAENNIIKVGPENKLQNSYYTCAYEQMATCYVLIISIAIYI